MSRSPVRALSLREQSHQNIAQRQGIRLGILKKKREGSLKRSRKTTDPQ